MSALSPARPIIVWILGLASSVAIISASMVFVADATISVLAPAAAATASAHRATPQRPPGIPDEDLAPTVLPPATSGVVNGPPPAAKALATAVVVPTSTPIQTSRPDIASAPEHMIVDAGSLNVRAEARASAARIGALQGGIVVEVEDREGAWARISEPHGTAGWVYAKYLSPLTSD